jgi:hypothetical protein
VLSRKYEISYNILLDTYEEERSVNIMLKNIRKIIRNDIVMIFLTFLNFTLIKATKTNLE